jgi:hypothetical protein
MNPTKFDSSGPPAEAFRFHAPAELFSEDADGAKRRRVRGVAYSGDVITDHGFWNRVAFDLSDTTVDSRIPMLVDHDRSRRAGFASLAITDRVEVAEAFLLDNAVGREVAADADAGFPWQFSIHIAPSRIEFVDQGMTVTVNGRQFDGPIHIFRGNRIRELSLTPVGADHRTAASVFTAGSVPAMPSAPSNEEPTMTATPEQFAALEARVAELTAAVQTLTAERDAAVQERENFRAQLAAQAQAARFAAVVALFRECGRPEPKDFAAAGHYMTLTDEQFAAVAKDMREARPTLPATLFGHTATGGGEAPAPGQESPLQFAARIRAKVQEERRNGRIINEAEAAAMLRSATA